MIKSDREFFSFLINRYIIIHGEGNLFRLLNSQNRDFGCTYVTGETCIEKFKARL